MSAIVPPSKRCSKCGAEYPATNKFFYRRSHAKDGLQDWCKACRAEYSRIHKKRNGETKPRISDKIIDGQKRCSQCGMFFPATSEFFPSEKRNSSGLHAQCRACGRERINAQYDPEKRKQYYAEHRERERETNRLYMQTHKQEIAKRRAEYHKTASYKAAKRKHRNKPEVRELDNLRSKIRFHVVVSGFSDLPDAITRHQWTRALEYFNGCCAVCGRPLRNLFDDVRPAIDHWIPISKGGTSTVGNLVPLCHGVGGCNNSKNDKMPKNWLEKKFGKRKAHEILARVEAYFEWAKGQL